MDVSCLKSLAHSRPRRRKHNKIW